MTLSAANPIRRVRDRHRDRSKGQSIVELALIAPVMLLILMVGLDFGRVFLGWVNLNNTARIAANFAAANATDLASAGTLHDDAIARYEALIQADATTINCTLPNPIPAPTFPSGTDLGDLAHVSLDCNFGVITPIISNILGSTVKISASSDFPVRSGIVANVPPGGGGSVNAGFNVSPASGVGSGATPLVVTYTDVSTGSPTSYDWDLNGDGVTDSTQVGNNPSPLTFAFTQPGTYFASLTVSNGTSTDTATQVITVNPPPGPVVVFTANPTSGTAPLAVSFSNGSTGTNPLTYQWDFDFAALERCAHRQTEEDQERGQEGADEHEQLAQAPDTCSEWHATRHRTPSRMSTAAKNASSRCMNGSVRRWPCSSLNRDSAGCSDSDAGRNSGCCARNASTTCSFSSGSLEQVA